MSVIFCRRFYRSSWRPITFWILLSEAGGGGGGGGGDGEWWMVVVAVVPDEYTAAATTTGNRKFHQVHRHRHRTVPSRSCARCSHTHTGVDDVRWWVGRIIGGEGENGFRRFAVEYNKNIKLYYRKKKPIWFRDRIFNYKHYTRCCTSQ